MSPRATLHLRIALATGIPFAVFMQLGAGLIGWGGFRSPWYFLSNLLFFGALMSLTIGSAHVAAVKRLLGRSPTPSDLEVYQAGATVLAKPPARAFESVHEALSSRPDTQVVGVDATTGWLRARSGANWKAWGYDIDVDVRSANGGSQVLIAARPRLRAQLCDYGESLRIVADCLARVASPTESPVPADA